MLLLLWCMGYSFLLWCMPFTYLFINLTQECDPRAKYLSDLFNQFINVYVVDGNSFTKVKAKNNAGRINFQTFHELKSFQPSTVQQNIGIHPMQHVSVNPMMYYGSPGEPMNYNGNIDDKTHVKTEKDSVGINTYNNGKNIFSQTDNIRQYNMDSQTDNIRQYNMGSQTHPIQHVKFSVNTNSSNPNFSTQTEPIDLSNKTTNTSYFNETTATQTQPLNFSTQTTNTPPSYFNTRPNSTQTTTSRQNSTSTQPAKEEDCQCEDNKSIQTFQSNFATQLHESSSRRNPEIRMQREIAVRPQQTITPKQAISHVPQQQQQQQQHALSPTRQKNMEIDYQSPAQLE